MENPLLGIVASTIFTIVVQARYPHHGVVRQGEPTNNLTDCVCGPLLAAALPRQA